MANQKITEFSNAMFMRMAFMFRRCAKWADSHIIREVQYESSIISKS